MAGTPAGPTLEGAIGAPAAAGPTPPTTAPEPVGDGPTLTPVPLRLLDAAGRPLAAASGTLLIRDGCVFLGAGLDGRTEAVVWPAGTTLNAAKDALVLPDGRTLPDGTQIEVGGGSVPYDEALEWAVESPSAAADACAKRATADSVFVALSDPGLIEVTSESSS